MSKDIFTSLDDTNELRKMIVEHPDYPLIIFVSEDSYSGEYGYNSAGVSSVCIQELTSYKEYYVERDEFEEFLYEECYDNFETDLEVEEYVQKRMSETEFINAIVIYLQ